LHNGQQTAILTVSLSSFLIHATLRLGNAARFRKSVCQQLKFGARPSCSPQKVTLRCRTWCHAAGPMGVREACVACQSRAWWHVACVMLEKRKRGGEWFWVKQTGRPSSTRNGHGPWACVDRRPAWCSGSLRNSSWTVNSTAAMPRCSRMAKAGQRKKSGKKVYSPPQECPCRR
jgi:hypothetical protein